MKQSRRRREPSVRMTAPRLLEALVKEPGKPARLTLVADTLEALQSIVDGPIEVTRLTEENVIVCNGEGMLRGLPRNAMGVPGTFLVLGRGTGNPSARSVTRAPCGRCWAARGDEGPHAAGQPAARRGGVPVHRARAHPAA